MLRLTVLMALLLLVRVESGVLAELPVAEVEESDHLSRGSVDVLLPLSPSLYLPLVGNRVGYAPPFGMQVYGYLGSSNGMPQVVDAGVSWLRNIISWAQVEPTNRAPSEYNWTSVDQTVKATRDQGIELILTIVDQPAWAAAEAMGPPYNPADLAQFVHALVERYDGDGIADAPGSPVVRYFELYNEPDNTPGHAEHGWSGVWGHNGAAYGTLLATLHPYVKSASTEANLVMGGLAMDWFEDEGGIFDRQFLDDVLTACQGRTCFDVMNFHYYPLYQDKWASYGPGIRGKTAFIRQKLQQYGRGHMPIICTETGWVSNSYWGSDELQGRYVIKGFVRGIAADLDLVIWFMLNDTSLSAEDFGILDSNLARKPSFYVYRTLTTQLKSATYARPLTSGDTGNGLVEGYRFFRAGNRLDVLWVEDATPFVPTDDPGVLLSLPAAQARITSKSGVSYMVTDTDDGSADGRIRLSVDGSPIYVEYLP